MGGAGLVYLTNGDESHAGSGGRSSSGVEHEELLSYSSWHSDPGDELELALKALSSVNEDEVTGAAGVVRMLSEVAAIVHGSSMAGSELALGGCFEI